MQNGMAPNLTSSPQNSTLKRLMKQTNFFIMYMILERSRLKTSEKIARKTLKNYNPHVMVWDLNK